MEFDAGDGDGRVLESLEAEHDVHPGLDVSVVLLDQVVQVFRRSHRRVLGHHQRALLRQIFEYLKGQAVPS